LSLNVGPPNYTLAQSTGKNGWPGLFARGQVSFRRSKNSSTMAEQELKLRVRQARILPNRLLCVRALSWLRVLDTKKDFFFKFPAYG
jgi:hypothetical protein